MSSTSNNSLKEFLENNIFTVSMKGDEEIDKYLADPCTDNEEQAKYLVNNNAKGDFKENEINNVKNPFGNPDVSAITIDGLIQRDHMSFTSESKRTFINRVFGKIDAGSVRGSIFSLAILCLGSAGLALPKKFGQISMLVALIDIVLVGIATYWTLNLMILASEKFQIFNYTKLVRVILGKGLSLFLEITILIYIFGVMILYQLVAYKLLGGVVNELGSIGSKSIDDFFDYGIWSKAYVKFPVMYGVALCIVLPLCLLKNISKMRFTSIFGIFSLFFLVMVIIFQTPWYFKDYLKNIYKEDDESTHLNIFDISSGFKPNSFYFFRGTATLYYAFLCHIGAFPVYSELKNNVFRRIQKVFSRSVLLDAGFYVVIGIAGYLSNPINTPDLIIERYKIFNYDIFMTIGWAAFMFTLMMKLPANYNSFRLTLLTLLGYEKVEISDKTNLLITIPTILLTCTAAALYSEIDDYISLLGSFCGVIISFFIPGLLYIKTNEYPIHHYKNILTIIIISLLCLIGLIAGILTIIGMLY